MKTYTATATREGRWWVLDVVDIGATQARSLRTAESQVSDMIAAVLDIDPREIRVDITPKLNADLAARVKSAREAVVALEETQARVAEQSRTTAAALKAAGLTGEDVAAVLGVSPQRVSQLTKSLSLPDGPISKLRTTSPPKGSDGRVRGGNRSHD